MPNHVHGILWLTRADERAGLRPAPTDRALSEVVRAFKAFSARRVNQLRCQPGSPLWQRNYYDHVIRNQTQLRRSREYIAANAGRWGSDAENPAGRISRSSDDEFPW